MKQNRRLPLCKKEKCPGGQSCPFIHGEQAQKLLKKNQNKFIYGELVFKETTTAKPCPICLDDYKIGEVLKIISCKHVFHRDCIKKWLQNNPVCPLCRGAHEKA
jgi:hypothetical protein